MIYDENKVNIFIFYVLYKNVNVCVCVFSFPCRQDFGERLTRDQKPNVLSNKSRTSFSLSFLILSEETNHLNKMKEKIEMKSFIK